MAVNKDRAEKAIKSAEREFRNAVTCLEDKDYVGSLKYLQECMEYAVKAVLIAYGIDYPKIHAAGRFLHEIKKYPQWFLKQIQEIAEFTDNLARAENSMKGMLEGRVVRRLLWLWPMRCFGLSILC